MMKEDDDQDKIDTLRRNRSHERFSDVIKQVVDLTKLRGKLDKRKGIYPQLRGRAYYDRNNDYLKERVKAENE